MAAMAVMLKGENYNQNCTPLVGFDPQLKHVVDYIQYHLQLKYYYQRKMG